MLEFLVGKAKLIDGAQAAQVKTKAMAEDLAIDTAAVQLNLFTEEQLVNALTQECWVPHLKVDKYEIRKKALDTIAAEDAAHYGVFPVDKLGSLLTLAMVNPLDVETIRVLEAKTGLDIKKVVATRGEIAQGVDKYYGGKVEAKDTSISFTQDVEPKSVTQMLAKVGPARSASSSDSGLLAPMPPPLSLPPAMPPPPVNIVPESITAEIQDIDELLSADEVIAPAIIEPIAIKPSDVRAEEPALVPRGREVAPPAFTPVPEAMEFEETDRVAPEPKAQPAPATIAPEFDEPVIAPPPSPSRRRACRPRSCRRWPRHVQPPPRRRPCRRSSRRWPRPSLRQPCPSRRWLRLPFRRRPPRAVRPSPAPRRLAPSRAPPAASPAAAVRRW